VEDPNRSFRQRSWDLDNVNWTPIYTSTFAQRLTVKNAGIDPIYIRTVAEMPASEDVIYPGETFSIECRFPPEIVAFYAKTASSTGPLKLREFTNGAP